MSWVWLLVVFVVIGGAIVWMEEGSDTEGPDTVEVCYCSGNGTQSMFVFCQQEDYSDDRFVTSGIFQRCEG